MIPEVQAPSWPQTAIDSFVLAKLEQNGMRPSAPADKPTLLRRVYFDLIGLPPTPEQLHAFLNDDSAGSFDRIVDQLLASPRYGERWARHWMDLVHYAETHGHDQDRIRTNAWPYRDYLIHSFNSDKPYARFVEEQIAGDTLYREDPQAVIAMGFLATGPWDESSLRDIRDDTIDRQIARYIDRDDIVTTVMSTFVSTTVQCARCHDHKFDPVSQSEYFGLQAVFAATDKANRFYDADPALHQRRQRLLKRKFALERREPAVLAELEMAESHANVARWENSLAATIPSWSALKPVLAASTNGATLEVLDDGSVLSSGKRPATDTYTIRAPVEATGVTGIRLEVLTDDSLPQKGPGRQDNGNLHLTNLRVFFSAGEETEELHLQNPSADFNQRDWEIAKAIDHDPKSAWGIHPAVGKAHQAVFEIQKPIARPGELTVVLEQNHGGGHLIGRTRLSVTTHPHPIRLSPLPDPIAQIVALPDAQRTREQNLDLAIYVAGLELEKEFAGLPEARQVYAGASEFVPDGSFKPAGRPRSVRILKRGDIHQPGDEAVPRALACVAGLNPKFECDATDEGQRRAALAKWITHPANSLAWRSIVNRVWQYHFGRGIVSTANDFGKMGSPPSHPELLDWLANWFYQNGGSFKKLNKLILTSAVYQQSSGDNPFFSTRDSDNRLLWRMNRGRLDAESVRDAILQITGKIDWKMGGPSEQQFVLSPGIHVTPNVDYNSFDIDTQGSYRRSIYRFVFRTLPDPFMDSLDCPDSSQLVATRNNSVTVQQALAMLNNRFVVRQSEHFAARLEQLAPGNSTQQVRTAVELAFCRAPRDVETAELAVFAEKHGMQNLCRVLFNSNEFMFVN